MSRRDRRNPNATKGAPPSGPLRLAMRDAALALLLSAFTGMPWVPVQAQSSSSENAVKAAFIYNFAKFVDWRPEAFVNDDTPFTICIWGTDSLKGALALLADKTVRRRPIRVRHLPSDATARGCQIVYVSRSATRNLRTSLRRVSGTHILTIGDTPHFAERGGIINLLRRGDRIGFAINLEAARASELAISAKLLRLAKIVGKTK